MHTTTCEINGDTSGEKILIQRLGTNNKHSNSNNNESNGHTTNNEELFISASSSTTDFQLIPGEKFKLIDDNEIISKLLMPFNNSTTITSELTSPAITLLEPSSPKKQVVVASTNNLEIPLIISSPSLQQPNTPKKTQCAAIENITPNNSEKRLEYEDLLQWKDMPKHLQFNPYVLTGYRPLQTVRGCFQSLFYWHNETINILTHGIPIVYILAFVPFSLPWGKDYRFLSFCHLFGAVAPWCGSFIYHLFMNLEKGEIVYYRLLKIDMLGIWISQSFGAMPMITASVFCFDYKWKYLCIISYSLLSLWGLYKAMVATSPWQRRLCFALPFGMRVILTILRTFRLVGGNPVALTHVYLQDLVSVFGGAIGAMHIPEKWFPGSVDLVFNSHNIMHVLVVVAVISMHKSTISDFEWMSKIECNNFYNSSETIEYSMNQHIDL